MQISKNGITKPIQQLIKLLRKYKLSGGDGWFSSSKNTNVVGNNLENINLFVHLTGVYRYSRGRLIKINDPEI